MKGVLSKSEFGTEIEKPRRYSRKNFGVRRQCPTRYIQQFASKHFARGRNTEYWGGILSKLLTINVRRVLEVLEVLSTVNCSINIRKM